ncbi:MAG: ABC transporter substrate-binding protein [Desulfobacteraceae bacterium]|nr:ABC transporter substrate-binding protein [Desulfobacteraceae bacterium]
MAILGLILMVALLPGRGWSGARTLEDMAGRTVTLTGEVNRIVTTFKPSSLCLFSLGLQEKLVGIDTSSKRDRLLKAVMPGLSKVTGVGSKSLDINFETVVALKPDLVILYAQKNGLELANRLETMGIKSIIILPESFDSVKTSLEIIAAAAGVPGRARKVEKIMDGVLDMVEKRVQTLSPDRRKTGYFASPRGLFSTATGSMLQDEIFTRAGVINVAHDLNGYFQDISPEQFMTWNPDMVILSQHLHQRVDNKLNDPALRRVTAISKKAVYRSPCDLAPWDFPSPLAALGTLWLANKAYPGLFEGIDINREIDLFHIRLFGKSLGDMNGNINDQVY